ncbi:MAG: acyl-CoA dehydrogenase [Myxococcales bacterium]|nr:MAG: acyl-CoA dehydrogenase [Myxococcales bacterium]
MSATDYCYDDRDLFFLLFEQMKIQDLCKSELYKDFGEDDFKMILTEAVKFAKEQVGPTAKEGDEQGCTLTDGQVHVPPAFVALHKAYSEAGWLAASGKPEHGGQGVPHVMGCALGDIFTAANTAFYLNGLLGVGVAHVLEKVGPDWMKEILAPKLFSGEWGGTMVLTEPSAGSDVGAAKTRAEKVPNEEGVYLVSGSKIFITAGDTDLTPNIIHLVLARTPNSPPGTKGLSIFIVPKIRIDQQGKMQGPNDVTCVRIEEKMGIHGSPTCQMSFGEKGQCKGWILGQEGDGIKIMFNMMNEARIEVGLQGCSTANAAYQNAKSYAKERLQGSSIKNFKDPTAPRVPIIDHPDVRRQLMTMKAFGEGMRGLLHYTAWCHDMARVAATPEDREKHMGFVELLTPICKAYCTDRGVEMASMAIQVYGGYGYTQDYPVERYMRDAKIGCIYEGTNSIQSLDLLARKLPMKRGMVFMSYVAELDRVANLAREHASLAELVEEFAAAKDRLVSVAMTLSGWGMQERLDLATSKAVPLLELMGDVVVASELFKAAIAADKTLNARLAAAKVDPNDKAAVLAHVAKSDESAFYYGKILNARFFVNYILPRTEGWAKAILKEDLSHMEAVF